MPSNEVTVRIHLRVTPKPAPPPDPVPPTPSDWRSLRRNIFIVGAILISAAFLGNISNPRPSQTTQDLQTQQPTQTTRIVAQAPTPFARPTPEVTAEPTLEPTPTEEPTPTPFIGLIDDGPIFNGESIDLPAYSVIEGDVKINGQQFYDNDENTGLIVVLNQQATVSVDPSWGASYQTYSDYQTAMNFAQEVHRPEMLQEGCVNNSGCSDVYIQVWP